MAHFVTNNQYTVLPKQTIKTELLFDQIQGKLRRAFENSSEAFRFFNIN